MFVCIFVMVNAEDLKYRQGDPIDIKVPCSNSGEVCSDVVSCNLTLQYPNGTNYLKRQNMTNQGEYFNYTLSNTNTAGRYEAVVHCSNTTLAYSTVFPIFITSYGDLDITPLTIIFAYGIIAAILLAISFMLDNSHILLKVFTIK